MEIKGSDIRKKYGSTEILKDVSMQVKDHQFVGIIGPNGSGKSTFLKCVYRILKPDNGAVYLDGQALLNMSVKESARKIAVVAQHNYYNFDFKIEEVVMMGRSPHKRNMERDNAEDYRIVNDCIEKVGMSRFKGRSFSTLSGGEQQRIILARALAQQTPCIEALKARKQAAPVQTLEERRQCKMAIFIGNSPKYVLGSRLHGQVQTDLS